MFYIGALILAMSFVLPIYLILTKYPVETKQLVFIVLVGLFVGTVLMLSDTITGVKISGIGELKAEARRAHASADEIEKLRSDAEIKYKETEAALHRAESSLINIGDSTEFSFLILKASNDDRFAYDRLMEISKGEPNKFSGLAKQTMVNIMSQQVSLNDGFPLPWQQFGLDPDTATIAQFETYYEKATPYVKEIVLARIWSQSRFSKREKLDFMVRVIRTTSSVKALNQACTLVNSEANRRPGGIGDYAFYLTWWEQHKNDYPGQ